MLLREGRPLVFSAAADGVGSDHPGVQGIAHIVTILIERIEGLEEQVDRLRTQEPSAA